MKKLLLLAIMLTLLVGALAIPPASATMEWSDLEVHGYMQSRYYVDFATNASVDGAGEISDVRKDNAFETERISLSGKMKMSNKISGYGELYIHPWLYRVHPSSVYLESFYLDCAVNPSAKLRVGKGRNNTFGVTPSAGNRKTSNYSPLQEMFTMDRTLGVQYLVSHPRNNWELSVCHSLRPQFRLIGQVAGEQYYGSSNAFLRTTVLHLADRDIPGDRSDKLTYSGRVGEKLGKSMEVGLSYRTGALDTTDEAYLAKYYSSYNGDLNLRRYGVDATYKAGSIYSLAQYFKGETGNIDNDGWEVLVGTEPNKPYCKGLYVRYGEQNIDVPSQVNKSWTWDTRQLAASYAIPLNKMNGHLKWLQFEYERNMEKVPSGSDEIPNDIFFVELFSAF
jgi:hypothetical protein